jgi:hypothetical protein
MRGTRDALQRRSGEQRNQHGRAIIVATCACLDVRVVWSVHFVQPVIAQSG